MKVAIRLERRLIVDEPLAVAKLRREFASLAAWASL